MRNGEVVLTWERTENPLYQLNIKPEIQKNQTELANACIYTALNTDLRASIVTRHQRLEHIGYHALRKMVQRDLTTGLNVTGDCVIPTTLCTGCELGKFTRLPLKEPAGLVN
jgi:hypothetical protein